jgi:ABC-type Zn uptake system ZnuABC Zn-binding protein ZnuA
MRSPGSRIGLPPRLRLNPAMVAIAITAMFAVSGCGRGQGPSPFSGTLDVVATTTVFADIVRNVGGDRVSVTALVPAGAGPEDYEPKPSDARLLADADLVVSNGVGLDDFLDRLIDSVGDPGAERLVLGDGIPALLVDGEPNPHFWLDPSLVADHYVPAIESTLSRLDPGGATGYAARGASYADQIREMDAASRTELGSIPADDRQLVTFHDAFPYFARHYGFELVGVILANVGQEPSAADLASLVEEVKATGTRAVFSEAQFNPELARTLADEAGVTRIVTTLYTDTVGPPPDDSYLTMMKWNVDQIVTALRP